MNSNVIAIILIVISLSIIGYVLKDSLISESQDLDPLQVDRNISLADFFQKVGVTFDDLRANLNSQNEEGDSWLHMAVKEDKPELVRGLVAEKIDQTLVNNDGKTALEIAQDKELTEIIEILQ